MGKEAVGYRQLVVWKKSMELIKLIYQLSHQLPESERYGLSSQSQRACVSIPANIAEGYGLGGGDYPRHLRIARGSLMELEVYLELFVTLDFIPRAKIVSAWKISQEIGAMLAALLQSLEHHSNIPAPRKRRP
jgi:four helix bundle protein